MLFFSLLCVFLLLISGIKAAYGQEPAKEIILLIADGWGQSATSPRFLSQMRHQGPFAPITITAAIHIIYNVE